MEKNISLRRKLGAGSLVVLGALGLTGCGKLDYSGEGNAFRVIGVVNNVEDDGTVKVQQDDIKIIDASGKATTWFPKHKGQNFLSDKFNFEQKYSQKPGNWLSCGHDVFVGKVYDGNGVTTDPQDLQPGTTVEIDGKIRESIYYHSTGKSGYCDGQDMAVYDTITEVPQG